MEQYGVWVKAEPQDIVEEAAPPPADFDFELPAAAPLAEEAFLSPDEKKLLGSFDTEFEAALPGSAAEPDLSSLPSIDDMPTIESSLLDEPPSKSDEIEELGSATIDISLEDIENLHRLSPIRPDAEIDMSSVEGLGGARPAPEMEDVSTEFLDAAPASALSPSVEDVTADFLDTETAAAPAATPEFESIDIDLHFDDTIPHKEEASAEASSLPGFEEVTEFDDFLSKEQASEPELPSQPFDDLAAVERELSESPARPAAAPAAAAPRPASSDLSTEILLKIADELASIRGELVSLKTQLGDLRREAEAGAAMEPPPAFDKDADETRAGGFFDEEEDETIALTGDELDNILNTADFTEEMAEMEAPAELEGAEPQIADNDLLAESLLPESGDYSSAPADLPAIEEINLSEDGAVEAAPSEPLLPKDSSADFGEIGLMAEEGVMPMTSAPEDTSYLETEEEEALSETLLEEPASRSSGFGDLGMSNVPLVEPDLSEFEAEELEAEPVSEIEEELPLVEEAEAIEPDMTLQTVAEVEPLESVDEVDHSGLTGIDLHEEPQSPIAEVEELAEIQDLPEAEEDASLLVSVEEVVEPEEAAAQDEDRSSGQGDSLFVEEQAEAEVPEALVEEVPILEAPLPSPKAPPAAAAEPEASDDSDRLKTEIRSVLSYLDKLLDSLPEEKIEEFARSEHFDTYKRLFEELGLV